MQNEHRPPKRQQRPPRRGTTLLELLVVCLILALLSTIATGVFLNQLRKARVAATMANIRSISIAATRYRIDTGSWPPSGTATVTVTAGAPVISSLIPTGSGLLHLALVHSLSGNVNMPFPTSWDGPYIEFQASELLGSDTLGRTQILDPWEMSMQFINSDDYPVTSGIVAINLFDPAELFPGARPLGASPDLPANNPFAATETFYNPTTFQIMSFGRDNATLAEPFRGTQDDDVNNFGY